MIIVYSNIRKVQLKFLFIGFVFVLSLNNSIAQSSNVIYLKAYNSLDQTRAKSTMSLENVLSTIDVKSFSRSIEPRLQKGGEMSEFYQEVLKIYRLEYNSGNADEIIAKLETTGIFEIIEVQPDIEVLYTPNDEYSQLAANGSPHIWGHDFPAAWDVSKGDTNTVVGYVDSGIRFDHDDMKANIYYNYEDTIDGVNNDGDQYFGEELVDNFRGWDMADWDNDPTINASFDHGLLITSMGAATPDNSIGIAGTGYNCRYMSVKVSTDAEPMNLKYGYDGMLYAAQSGCDVINLSWGYVGAPSEIIENYINYIVNDLNIVLVAAAGNSGKEEYYLPASFSNVICVTGVKADTIVEPNSTYNNLVDVNVIDVINKNARFRYSDSLMYYGWEQGTSIASALVSGAVGLIRSHRPELTAAQIRQLLSVTGFRNDTLNDPKYFEKIGYFLNPHRALTDTVVSALKMTDYYLDQDFQFSEQQGDTLYIAMDFKNHLFQSKNSVVTLKLVSENAVILDSTVKLGVVTASGIADNFSSPFKLFVPATSNSSELLEFKLEFQDSTSFDYQFFQVELTPSVVTQTDLPDLISNWDVFPQPAKEYLTIVSENKNDFSVEIRNLTGQVLLIQQCEGQFETIDVSSLSTGVYVLAFRQDDFVEFKKIQIE